MLTFAHVLLFVVVLVVVIIYFGLKIQELVDFTVVLLVATTKTRSVNHFASMHVAG